jgi:hypothetical protein
MEWSGHAEKETTMARRGYLLAVGAAAVIGAGAACPALGQGWLTPVAVSPQGGFAQDAALLPAPDGALMALWRRAPGGGDSRIEYRAVDADGALGPVGVLSGASDATAFRAARSQDGTVHVAWSEFVPGVGDTRVFFRRIGADGRLGPTLTISNPGGRQPRVGAAADGTAIVVWRDGGPAVSAARIAPGAPSANLVGGMPAPTLDAGEHPDLAVGSDGTAFVAYADSIDVLTRRPRAVRIPAGQGAGAPFELHMVNDVFVRGVRLAIEPSGVAHAAWHRSPDGSTEAVETRTISPAGVPGMLAQRSDGTGQSRAPAIAATSGGVSVAWIRSLDGEDRVQAVAEPLGDSFTPLSAAGVGATGVAVGRAEGGRTVVAWQRPDAPGDPGRVQAAVIAADGAAGAARTLSAPGGQAQAPTAAALPFGEAAVAWEQDLPPAGDRAVHLAHFDGRPPQVTASVPARATAGTPAAMSALAVDRSAVSFSWDLGDGAVADGAGIAHTYSGPGTRTVTLTATDAAGNASVSTHTVDVVPAASAPAPVLPAAPDTTAPRLSAVSVRPASARRGPRPALTTRTVTIRFRLDEAARVRLRVQRSAPGRRRGVRCVAPTRALVAARARACVRLITVGGVTRRESAGAGRITITRLRVGRRTLVPGTHRLTLTATDAAGNRSAPVARILRVRAGRR